MRGFLIILLVLLTIRAQPLPIYASRDARSQSSLLLDLYPGASMAYSVRKLRSGYSGPAIRIKPDGVTNQYDIGFVGENLDSATAVNVTTNLGRHIAYVSIWYDQSTNANHLYATNDAGMSQIISSDAVNMYGTRPVITDAGGEVGRWHYYLNTPVSGSQPWSMSVIWQRNVTNSPLYSMVFLSNQSATPEVLTDSPGTTLPTAVLYAATTSHYSSCDTSTNTYAIMGVFANASSEDVYFGTVQKTPIVNHTSLPGSSNFEVLGFSSATASTGLGHHGSMQEVIFWPSDQSTNRLQVYTNQNAYFQTY